MCIHPCRCAFVYFTIQYCIAYSRTISLFQSQDVSEWNCSLPSVSYCWWSFISEHLSRPLSPPVSNSSCLFNWRRPCMPVVTLYYCTFQPVVPDSLWPHGLQPTRLLCLWDFPGKDTGMGCHFLLQEIFETQGSNSGPLRCRQMLYRRSYLFVWKHYKPTTVWYYIASCVTRIPRPTLLDLCTNWTALSEQNSFICRGLTE